MRTLLPCFVFLTVFFFTATLQSTIFEWVDEKGIKYFSDRPRNNIAENVPENRQDNFIPLAKDTRAASDKLKALQGNWIQINSSPSTLELINRMDAIWGSIAKPMAFDKMESLLTVQRNTITLQNKPNEVVTQTNTYKETQRPMHTAKLEFYNGIPLEVSGYWSFEKGFNPVVKGFLDQLEANNNIWKYSEQVRFDIQASKLMVTVKLPAEFKIPLLKIIYEKQYK
ncbi:MAG: hypothetical protein PUP46_05715 [Endozoicomonas sp. (ex Botrylloides leachii)]|nr:hypothetical protein [Endozoicomonas sp. (ex Botrylloides leachii)]